MQYIQVITKFETICHNFQKFLHILQLSLLQSYESLAEQALIVNGEAHIVQYSFPKCFIEYKKWIWMGGDVGKNLEGYQGRNFNQNILYEKYLFLIKVKRKDGQFFRRAYLMS